MIECSGHTERLYLVKGEIEDLDVAVDTICLPQHQYDGIRFLHKHFKKGKPGVILNDPSGYGKRIQAIIFLTAMRNVMSSPILILCPDSKQQIWTHLFSKWSNLGSDVSVQKSYELIKPVCLISTYFYISALTQQEWGILLIDDNSVSRDVLRSGLKTKYKIWLTSMDMKKNLQTFSLIYKWFYPNKRFVVEDFQITKKTPSALLTQSARIDGFMEDIVIRRTGVTLPLGKENQTLQTQSVSQKSKNKDPTGKKIKRSKPRPECNEESSESQGKVEAKVMVKLCNNEEIENKNYSIDDFEISVNDKVQAKIDGNLTLPVAPNLKNEIEGCTKKFNDKGKEQVMSEVMEIEYNDDNHNKKMHLAVNCNDNKLLDSEDIHSQNIIIKYDSDTPDIDDDDVIPAKSIKYTHDMNCEDYQAESKDLFSTDTLESQHKIKVENKEIMCINNAVEVTTDETDSKYNKIHSEHIFSADLPPNEVKHEIKTNENNENEVVNKNNISEINKTDPKVDGIELKMKRMEELAMKKFKGSFLDKMF